MIIAANLVEVGVKMLTKYLREGVVEVQFTKKDGTLRVMNCTKDMTKIPVENHPKPQPVTEESGALDLDDLPPYTQKPVQLITVFDVDKQEWRSFNYTTVRSISLAN